MKIIVLILFVVIAFFLYRSLQTQSKIPLVGQPAPDFKLSDSKQQAHTLSSYAGKWLVLYFYPKDDTPGCTKEACHFRDDLAQLEKLGAKVVGVSVDDSGSHAKFSEKYHLPFPLLADTDGKVADAYGALQHLGITKIAKRYTFLISPDGKVTKVYLSVDTSRHSQEIINDLTQLKNQ